MDQMAFVAVILLSGFLGIFLGFIGGRISTKSTHETLINQIEHLNSEHAVLLLNLEKIQTKLNASEQTNVRLQTNETNLNKTVADKDKLLSNLQTTLKIQFENIANNVLSNISNNIDAKSNTTLEQTLKPLKDKMVAFENHVTNTHKTDIRERAGLVAELKKLHELNTSLNEQALNLTNALKAQPQKRGEWAEFILKKILESSGLREGHEFIEQGKGLKLKDETGKHQKPDIIILLPENKSIVIDSKFPLIHYDRFIAAKNPDDEREASNNLVSAFRNQIDELANAKYQHNEKLYAHEYALMFVCLEGAISVALEAHRNKYRQDLFDYAWSKNIVIVGPSSLMMTIKTVETIWRYEHTNTHALKISEEAGRLYDTIVNSMARVNDVGQSLDKIGQSLDTAKDNYRKHIRWLSQGSGSVRTKAETLKRLGAKNTKQMPELVGSNDIISLADHEFLEHTTDPNNESS